MHDKQCLRIIFNPFSLLQVSSARSGLLAPTRWSNRRVTSAKETADNNCYDFGGRGLIV
jgi:hypothetical protein